MVWLGWVPHITLRLSSSDFPSIRSVQTHVGLTYFYNCTRYKNYGCFSWYTNLLSVPLFSCVETFARLSEWDYNQHGSLYYYYWIINRFLSYMASGFKGVRTSCECQSEGLYSPCRIQRYFCASWGSPLDSSKVSKVHGGSSIHYLPSTRAVFLKTEGCEPISSGSPFISWCVLFLVYWNIYSKYILSIVAFLILWTAVRDKCPDPFVGHNTSTEPEFPKEIQL